MFGGDYWVWEPRRPCFPRDPRSCPLPCGMGACPLWSFSDLPGTLGVKGLGGGCRIGGGGCGGFGEIGIRILGLGVKSL